MACRRREISSSFHLFFRHVSLLFLLCSKNPVTSACVDGWRRTFIGFPTGDPSISTLKNQGLFSLTGKNWPFVLSTFKSSGVKAHTSPSHASSTSIEPQSQPPTPSDAFLKAKTFLIALQLSRSGSAQIPPEEYSHWASLMAGDSSPGPSDAPCLVESSTAHGGSIFRSDQRLNPIYWTPATIQLRSSSHGGKKSALSLRTATCLDEREDSKRQNPNCSDGPLLLDGLLFFWPLRYLPRPMSSFIGLTQLASWTRSVSLNFLSNHNLLMSLNYAENGRGLHLLIVVTLIVRIDKHLLLTLEEDILSAADCFNLSKKPMLSSSSVIERTFTWSSISLLRIWLCSLTIFIEVACIKLVIPKIKDPFSTSLGLYWNVTIQQSLEVFVELSSTHHYIACGKLLSCFCLRCMELASNYLIYFLYHSLVRVLVAIFDASNHEVEVHVNFVLGMD